MHITYLHFTVQQGGMIVKQRLDFICGNVFNNRVFQIIFLKLLLLLFLFEPYKKILGNNFFQILCLSRLLLFKWILQRGRTFLFQRQPSVNLFLKQQRTGIVDEKRKSSIKFKKIIIFFSKNSVSPGVSAREKKTYFIPPWLSLSGGN